MLRPALVCLAGLAVGSCGMVESDPNRFENLARTVADIPLDDGFRPVRTAAESGLRPAMVSAEAVENPGDLRVEVMDPHDLWDARDAGLRGAVEQAAPAMIEAAAPMVVAAVAQQVAERMPPPRVERLAVRATPPPPVRSGPVALTTLQLGAFSSPVAARAAWARIASAGETVARLSPLFEAVEVDGRTLTRLRVRAPEDAARVVCRAADAARLGCLRRS